MLSVLSLPFSGLLLVRGGRVVTLGLALVHGAVCLVASGRILSGVLSGFGGALSRSCRALLGCACPVVGESCVGLVAVHLAIF